MDKKKTLETFLPVLIPAALIILGGIAVVKSLFAVAALVAIVALLIVGAQQSVR